MGDELLPCPFCGKEANVSECQGRDDRFYVWCDGCCCTVMYRSRQAAIDAWNTRSERTCRLKMTTVGWSCSACHVVSWTTERKPKPNYCPHCGAKVVE